MKKLTKTHYKTLLTDIAALYASAQRTLVETYWKIGKRIVAFEQKGEARAEYGTHLLEHLSADLTKTCGKGFSRPNLIRMRQLYCAHKKRSTLNELAWTKQVTLLSLHDTRARQHLEKRAMREGLTHRELQDAVKTIKKKATRSVTASPLTKKTTLTVTRNPVHVFQKLTIAEAPRPKGMVVVDCGFHIWRTVTKKECADLSFGKMRYTYPATVLSIIDGDTIWARIDCGFGTQITEKLRFRGIDAPELPTADGLTAKRFVARALSTTQTIVVYTRTSDKYDRYLADIFYLPESKDPARIAREGRYLNQELLDAGLASAW